jgi:transmembrane sensor
VNADDRFHEHDDEALQQLIDRAVRGTLGTDESAALEHHLAGCPTCAAELDAMRACNASLSSRPNDDEHDRVAIERVMAQVGERGTVHELRASDTRDDALDRLAVERTMARLTVRERFGPKVRRHWRPAAGIAGLGAAAAIAFAGLNATPPRTATPTTEALAPRPAALVLADGSEIVPDNAATAIQVGEDTPERTTVRLPAGAAGFRVRHDARRLFHVDAGSVQIDDLGTVFRVAHETGGRVHVSVSEGRVAVRSTAGGLRVELGAGEDRVFSGPNESGEPRAAIGRSPDSGTPPPLVTTAGEARVTSRARVPEGPTDLLAAADVARRSRQPRAAVPPLRRLLDNFPKDPRAPSAAFTLGWIYLTDLNRPREAAVAFAEAERIAPRGALAEDAAARVAEAWQNAGDSRRAAEAARHYSQVYPTGRYIALMRGLIGDH